MSPVNPFQNPKPEMPAPVVPAQALLAGRGQRLGAVIIDAVIGMAFGIPMIFALGI